MNWTFHPTHVFRVTLTQLPHNLRIVLVDRRQLDIPFGTREEAEKACENLISYGKQNRIRVRILGYGDVEIDD